MFSRLLNVMIYAAPIWDTPPLSRSYNNSVRIEYESGGFFNISAEEDLLSAPLHLEHSDLPRRRETVAPSGS